MITFCALIFSLTQPLLAAEKKILIGFAQSNFSEPWRQAMNAEMRAAAAKHPEIDLKFSDGNQDNSKQVADVENFIRQRVDVLLISPNEALPLTGVVRKAYKQGIPVIVIDRKVMGDDFTSFVGADNRLIGREAGKVALKILGGKGRVVELKGLSGSTPAMERGQGFHDVIDKYPGIKVIHSATADWLRDKGRAQMEMALQAHNAPNDKIDLVYSHNDPMAMGAWLAAKAVGREKEMKFIGIDALPGSDGGIKMVIDGKLAATFVYPTGAAKAFELAVMASQKKTIPHAVTLPTMAITPENAAHAFSHAAGIAEQ